MTEVQSRRRWAVLATVATGLLLITLDNSILYTALPTLTEELGASGSQSLWIINAYPVVMAGLLLGSGTLGDRVGHRVMFLLGLGVFGLASSWAAFSPSPESLIAARAVLAVGAAAMMPATLALVRVMFTDPRERTLAIAIWGSISVVGASLGPILGGSLLERFWWGSVFLINVPVVIVALVAGWVVTPANDPDPSKRWDLVSSVQVMVALVGLVLVIKELGHVPQNWPLIVVAGIASAIACVLFLRRQRRLEDPLLDFTIFTNAAFSGGVLAAGAALFTIAGVQLVTTQRYQLVEDFSPLQAGLLVAAVAVGSLPTAMVGGALLHKIGLRILIAGGIGGAAVGVVIMMAGVAADVFGVVITGLVVTGLGLGGAFSVASTAIVGNAPSRRAGMAASVEEVSYEFGSLTAVAVLGSLLSFVYAATVQLPSSVSGQGRASLTDTLATAQGNPEILTPAFAAFDTAYIVTLAVIAGVLALTALATARLLRAHGPGSESQSYPDNH